MNEAGYLNSLRERSLRRQILTTVGKVVNSPQILVDALNSFNGETRTLRFVLVADSVAGTIPDPTEEDLKHFYENHQTKFTEPEYRKVGVLAVTPETVKDQVKITDADLKAAYEANKDKLGNPEKRHVQQIPFPDLAAANAAYQKIQSGTDFVAIAKEHEPGRKRYRSRHRRARRSRRSRDRRRRLQTRRQQGERAGHRQAGQRGPAARHGDRARQDSHLRRSQARA